MRYSEIGTRSNPVRASSLSALGMCEGLWLLRQCEGEPTISEPMASGTAAGRAVQLWHEGAPGPFDQAMAESPEADEERVRKAFDGYILDPRNRDCVEVDSLELEVTLLRRGVHFSGHLDQVRVVDGRREVWDLKLSRMGGTQLANCYIYQLALYAVAADADPGGIIRLTDYGRRGGDGPVMYPLGMTRDHAEALVDRLVSRVHMLRRGGACYSPSHACSMCEGTPATCEELVRARMGPVCEQCGQPYPGRTGQRYCSRQCAGAARRGVVELPDMEGLA